MNILIEVFGKLQKLPLAGSRSSAYSPFVMVGGNVFGESPSGEALALHLAELLRRAGFSPEAAAPKFHADWRSWRLRRTSLTGERPAPLDAKKADRVTFVLEAPRFSSHPKRLSFADLSSKTGESLCRVATGLLRQFVPH